MRLLLDGKYSHIKTEIDEEDLQLVLRYKLYGKPANGKLYVYAYKDSVLYYLARVLMNAPASMLVDHIDRDPLNNKKSNLRIATVLENNNNIDRSGQGVQKTRYGTYRVRLSCNGVRHHLGTYKTEELAKRIYDLNHKKFFGN